MNKILQKQKLLKMIFVLTISNLVLLGCTSVSNDDSPNNQNFTEKLINSIYINNDSSQPIIYTYNSYGDLVKINLGSQVTEFEYENSKPVKYINSSVYYDISYSGNFISNIIKKTSNDEITFKFEYFYENNQLVEVKHFTYENETYSEVANSLFEYQNGKLYKRIVPNLGYYFIYEYDNKKNAHFNIPTYQIVSHIENYDYSVNQNNITKETLYNLSDDSFNSEKTMTYEFDSEGFPTISNVILGDGTEYSLNYNYNF